MKYFLILFVVAVFGLTSCTDRDLITTPIFGDEISGDDLNDDGGNGDEYVDIDIDQLPDSILDYISENYPDSEIRRAQKDDDGYEVYLKNGLELNFDSNGNFLYADDEDYGDDDDWNDDYRTIDPNDLPNNILDYISENYPNSEIRRAQKDDDGYEVYLENGYELNFDSNGNFLYEDRD